MEKDTNLPGMYLETPQIYPPKNQRVDMALGKPTKQRSTDYGGISSRAVDGNDDTNYRNRSCTHTRSGRNEWWHVDLGETKLVQTVVIANRQDNRYAKYRLQGTKVCVGQTQNAVEGDSYRNLRCQQIPRGSTGPKIEVQFDPPAEGRFVAVKHLNRWSKSITLCGVKVYEKGSSWQNVHKATLPKPTTINKINIYARMLDMSSTDNSDVKVVAIGSYRGKRSWEKTLMHRRYDTPEQMNNWKPEDTTGGVNYAGTQQTMACPDNMPVGTGTQQCGGGFSKGLTDTIEIWNYSVHKGSIKNISFNLNQVPLR